MSWTLYEDDPPPKPVGTSPHHAAMIARYGQGSGFCRDCKHLGGHHQSARWFKCRIYSAGRKEGHDGPATDWRAKWRACGKWEGR